MGIDKGLLPLKARLYLELKRLQGSELPRYYSRLRQSQYNSYKMLQQQQSVLLRQLLEEAYRYVPAYRERFATAGVVSEAGIHLERFRDIPLLSRADITFQSEAFTHVKAHERGAYVFETGGSTGTPVKLKQDKQYKDWFLAHYHYLNLWGDLTIGTPYFFLWAAYRDIEPQLTSWRKKFVLGHLQGRHVLNCRVSSPELFHEFIETINRHKHCTHIIGYAYELYALACYSLENNMPLNRPFSVVYATAENLTERMRQTIQQVFQCPVINRYGCREIHDIASECRYMNGMHLSPLNVIVEVVDEQGLPLPYGEEGEIVVTSLHNYAMPLIRYRLGDRGVLQEPSHCSCGRECEKILKLSGRTAEKLILPDGSWMGGAFFQTAFDDLPFLMRHQIHQLEPERLSVYLRSSVPGYPQAYCRQLEIVTSRIREWAGCPALQIDYVQTDAFDRTLTGKEPTFVQRIDPSTLSRIEGRVTQETSH